MSALLQLSSAQYGIWLGQQLNLNSSAYNTAECVEIAGPLQEEAFKQAVYQVLQETQALRLSIIQQADNTPRQSIQPLAGWSLAVIDFTSQNNPQQAAKQWMSNHLKEAVDVSVGPLYYPALLKLGANQYYWYQRIHHAVIDGYGFSLIIKRVADLYTATVNQVSPVSKPFGCLTKVIEEDLSYRNSSRYEQDKLFWQQQMASLSRVATFSQSTSTISQDFIRYEASIDPSLVKTVEMLAKKLGVSWLDVFVAIFAVFISQYRNQFEDIVIGLPVMNRLGSHAIRVPCMQMNIIPLRIQIDANDSFSTVVMKVSEKIRLTKKHQKYRYEDMKRDLGLLGGDQRLFGPVINIMPFDNNLNFGEYKAEIHNLTAGPVEDISFGILVPGQGQGMRLNVDANPVCYNEKTIQGLSQDYLALITRLTESPEIIVCNQSQSVQLLNGGESLVANRTVIQLIADSVKQYGDKSAVIHEGVGLTYNELNDYAHLIANLVTSKTRFDNKNPLIAILLPRSIDAISSILGVLMAGAGYLPLDPEWPALRIHEVLEDAQPDLVITYSCYQEQLTGNIRKVLFLNEYIRSPIESSAEVVQWLTPKTELDSVAYVIYTSGSTGKPNGVAISHGALANFVTAAAQCYGVDNKDSILQFAPLQFDASVEEVFLALCTGGSLVLRTEEMLNSIPQLLSDCAKHKITVLDLPTAFWHELTLSMTWENIPPTLKTVIIGGEAALPERLACWQNQVGCSVKLLNTYGPTETTVVATFADISKVDPDNQPLSIGQPLPGVKAVILDSQLQPTAGEGELYLLGRSLANGYLNRPELNQRRFINLDCLPGHPKAYRTGDRVKLNENNELIYLGRIDDEFKISGYRVNPAEIENILIKQPSIQDAAVVGQTLTNGSKRLVAFVVLQPHLQITLTSEAIRHILLEEMPPAVVPSAIKLVSQLPKTTSGKIDRKQLQSIFQQEESTQKTTVTVTPLEKTILGIWSDVLGQTALSPQDDFFKIGGQSLQTIQVANRLGLELNQTIAVADIFKYPVAADLAAILLNSDLNKTTNKEAVLALGDHILEEEYVAKNLNKVVINSHPKKILLTGVTGFVGAQLLHKLLKHTSAEIYCLVRANNKQQAWERIKAALTQQQLAVNEDESRIIPVISDLSRPLLGLEEQEFDWLANECDAIYHNAAVVSIVRDYTSLRDVNVLATKELLKLAASNRVMPFHHISTQAVAAPPAIMDELPETFINYHAGLIDGYQQSKWAAEHLVQQAGKRGLPVSLYRLGRVTGAMETGYVNKQDFFWRIIHASIPIKAIPQINVEEVWTPVDFVADAVSRISLAQTTGPRVFNLALDRKVLLSNLFQWMEEFGYQLTSLPLFDWKTQVKKYANDEDLAVVAFFDMRSTDGVNKSTEKKIANKIANQKFKEEINKINLIQPAISKELFFKYLKFAIKNKLILGPDL
ncbi:amino acid adenylation domain-containing protein [Endozoicomonas sp. SM1973]|uniref:Amino acid adenylation domain-containing protein n=1 Tax=Spartinivicinus marinus TaxID=2994442 RepID=A0A853IGS7_9GAMM|nr:non-ribosomal peptide synthetase [Spartinivicinus marinus]MCX4026889.1 non-ribosomal peptide synthetase [Spartinivicinus marinus]NYZ66766.1 amino acid adenylation domain-containing protein [Spartinivicinus marinus]